MTTSVTTTRSFARRSALIPCAIWAWTLVVPPAWAQEEDSSAPLMADDPEAPYQGIDLDGVPPLERVYPLHVGTEENRDAFVVIVWHGDRRQWVEVFRGSGRAAARGDAPADFDVTVAELTPGGVASLDHGGRRWEWDGSVYRPLGRRHEGEPTASMSQEEADEAASLAGVGAGSGAEIYSYEEPDGSVVRLAVYAGDPADCADGGSLCPAVLLRADGPVANLGVHMGYWWGPSERVDERGHRLIEQGRADGVMLRDPDDGSVVDVVGVKRVEVAPIQPPEPAS